MFKISILYPNEAGKRFDMDYYATQHKELVVERLKEFGLAGMTVDKGISGGAPGSDAPFVCVGHLRMETMEGYKAAMKAHGKALMADAPNYTDITPLVQISEILR